jgi:phosphogluconate dehydratase
MIHPKIQEVTTRIIERSKESRALYLSQMRAQFDVDFNRSHLHCGNLAHAFAGCGPTDKKNLSEDIVPKLHTKLLRTIRMNCENTLQNTTL